MQVPRPAHSAALEPTMALQVHACFRMRFMCLRVCVALRPMLSNANIVVAFVFEDKGKHQS